MATEDLQMKKLTAHLTPRGEKAQDAGTHLNISDRNSVLASRVQELETSIAAETELKQQLEPQVDALTAENAEMKCPHPPTRNGACTTYC
jgi:hypothetical protein